MDKIKEKSQTKIVNAFFELRKKKPIEKISVVDLCKLAGVNKSTFYYHYCDVYDLSDKLETQLMEEIISSISDPETLLEDTNAISKELFKAYISRLDRINVLFSGTRSAMLPKKINTSIRRLVYRYHPEYVHDKKINILLSYQIYGGFYAFLENEIYGSDYVISVLFGDK